MSPLTARLTTWYGLAMKKKAASLEVKATILGVRLTARERRALDQAAAGNGLKTSVWARNVLLKRIGLVVLLVAVPATDLRAADG